MFRRCLLVAILATVIPLRGFAMQIPCPDSDKDGYGTKASGKCVHPGIDCNDLNAAMNPGAAERCNGEDDNCNNFIDETFPTVGTPCASAEGACFGAAWISCSADQKGTRCVPKSTVDRLYAYACYQLVQDGSTPFWWGSGGQTWPETALNLGAPLRASQGSPETPLRVRPFQGGLVVVNTSLTAPAWFLLPSAPDVGAAPSPIINAMLYTNFERAKIVTDAAGVRSVQWQPASPVFQVAPKDAVIFRIKVRP